MRNTGTSIIAAFLLAGCGAAGKAPAAGGGDVSVRVDPANITVSSGATVQFTAKVTGTTETSVTWALAEGASAGMVSADGLYTAPSSPGTFHLVISSVAAPETSAVASILVVPDPISVTIEPDQTEIELGSLSPVQFRAHVTGAADGSVSWSIEEAPGGGAIDPSGTYTPPVSAGDFHVVATSRADPARTSVALVSIRAGVVDHGGPIVTTSRTFALWWGDPAAFAGDARATLERFLGALDGSGYLAIADEYMRGAHPTTTFAGSLVDPSAPPVTDPPPTAIGDAACRALLAKGIAPQAGDMVLVNTSTFPQFPGVAPYCAWHSSFFCQNQALLIVYLPNPAGTSCVSPDDHCGTGTSMPTRSLLLGAAHEFMESITDPFRSSWYFGSERPQEIADLCGVPHCVSLGRDVFELPDLYSTLQGGCVIR